MKIGFIYSGQGSQEPLMGLDFYNNEEYVKNYYDNLSNSDEVKKILFDLDKETLSQTEYTQIALVSFQIMVTDLLKREKIEASSLCGLSIGEYSALYAANVLKKEEVLSIASYRGKSMSESTKDLETSMYAILNASEDIIKESIKKIVKTNKDTEKYVEISNINSPKQIVISGDKKLVKEVINDLRVRNIRVVKLNVSGPFHTKYMNKTSQELKEFFKNIEFNKASKDLYLNLTGEKYKGEDLKEVMVKQVNHTVRFYDDILNMIKDGVDLFIEIGFNNVIKKIIKSINKDIKVIRLAKYEDFIGLKEELYGK